MPSYEVWCHSCNVTFPPKTKRCLHCGARVHPDEPSRSLRGRVQAEIEMLPMAFGDAIQPAPETIGGPNEEAAPAPADEEPVKRSLLRAGMTLVWMVLLAAGYAWRACSQQ
jgi:hypothetical protein